LKDILGKQVMKKLPRIELSKIRDKEQYFLVAVMASGFYNSLHS